MIDRSRLAVNPAAAARTVRIGPEEHHEALVVDDLFVDPDYVRALALSLDFAAPRGTFPGYEARISIDPGALLTAARRWVSPELVITPSYRNALVFSMMHEGVDAALRHYPHPHVDDHLDDGLTCFGAVVYLNPPDQCRGGTSFYRHRQTGACENREEISPGIAAYMVEHGLRTVAEAYEHLAAVPERDPAELVGEWGYIRGSNDTWERLATLEMRFNRLVLFDCYLFHNPDIEDGAFGRTPDTRRLTLTTFFALPRR
ncbi:MAG: DUF6445 family protein [Myxococcota bacterium]